MPARCASSHVPLDGLEKRRRRAALKPGRGSSDETSMNLNALALLLVAGIALTLYIMRRRSRTGKRTPKF
jgi:hypothetical protein